MINGIRYCRLISMGRVDPRDGWLRYAKAAIAILNELNNLSGYEGGKYKMATKVKSKAKSAVKTAKKAVKAKAKKK